MPDTERHPAGYDWRSRFPHAARVLVAEGGEVYAAEEPALRSCWLISDESTMADFLGPDDVDGLVTLRRYGAQSRWEWVRDIVAKRQVNNASADDAIVKTWPGPYDSALIALVDDTAARIERQAAAEGLQAVNEQSHLQPRAMDSARALALRGGPGLRTQVRVDFDVWPRLGSIDLALDWPGDEPVLLELKCGAGLDAVAECVWDIAKLALALQRKVGAVGLLLAGAPVADWNKPVRGAEFFADGSHDVSLLRVLYADWWRHWEKREDPQPTALPASWWTEHAHTAPFSIGATEWELRLAQVFVSSEDLTDWPRLT